MRTRVKICGITRPQDALAAATSWAQARLRFEDKHDRPVHERVLREAARVLAGDLVVERLPRRETVLGRVLLPDVPGIVEGHSSMTRPGSFLPGALPPSHAFTVAPTSENSPSSCTRPAALRPAAYASRSARGTKMAGR